MQELTLKPDAFAYRGKAVATMPSGKRCFIRGGAPGDTLLCAVAKEKKNCAEAEIKEIIEPSPDRIQPVCRYAELCPGCAYSQVDYPVELEWKQKQFERFLLHSHLAEPSAMREPVAASRRMGWRNKIKLTAEKNGEKIRIGYRMEDNKTVLDVRECLLARPEIARLMDEKLNDPAFRASLPEGISALTFRYTPHDGALLLEAEDSEEFLTDTIRPYGEFAVPRNSFFQINTEMASKLAAEFLRIVEEVKPEVFIELYCGCGVFSVLAAEAGVGKVYGVELDPDAVRAANRNLHEHGLPHCKFLAGDAVRMLGQLPLQTKQRPLMLVDPPRTGLERPVIDALSGSAAHDLVYVSCGPDTLARDLALFRRQGWTVAETGLFDLFPSTAHFESLTWLKRG